MSAAFISQPDGTFRTGDFLSQGFANEAWSEFRAAVAFVKRSGTKHVGEALEAFSKRGGRVRISAGIDAGGTSAEGLEALLNAVSDRGSIFVFKNANSSTFHPKVYLFRNADAAEIVVGSGNLTEGGLFTNYEASLVLRLNLADEHDAALCQSICDSMDIWSAPTPSLCYSLDSELLAKLVASGEIPHEAQAWGDEKIKEMARTAVSGLFGRHPVPGAPKVKVLPAAVPEEETDTDQIDEEEGLDVPVPQPVAPQAGDHTAFVMSLQQTDVGVGQTTKGATRRSPEIFIPLKARDTDPDFWGWPGLFAVDAKWTGKIDGAGRGKLDRTNVMVRLGGTIFPVTFWYNPDKRDLRLRSEDLRSAGVIGDILYIERSDGSGGYAYYVEIVPQTSARHAGLLAACDKTVRNSKKVFGYI